MDISKKQTPWAKSMERGRNRGYIQCRHVEGKVRCNVQGVKHHGQASWLCFEHRV